MNIARILCRDVCTKIENSLLIKHPICKYNAYAGTALRMWLRRPIKWTIIGSWWEFSLNPTKNFILLVSHTIGCKKNRGYKTKAMWCLKTSWISASTHLFICSTCALKIRLNCFNKAELIRLHWIVRIARAHFGPIAIIHSASLIYEKRISACKYA